MEINVIAAKNRVEFRQWLTDYSATEKDCWIVCKRKEDSADNCIWYIDAVEEALCFGWIDSVVKTVNGECCHRFSPRKKGSNWTELNKERCRRLEKLGLMTDAGRAVLPDMSVEIKICDEIEQAFAENEQARLNFQSFPPLYQRVRINTIQTKRREPELFKKRLAKLIEASEKGIMIGEWNDNGRLLNY